MPRKIHWRPETDATIRRMRTERASWRAIASALGCSRWTAIERGRHINALIGDAPPIAIARTDRETMPPGHPVSWDAICAGTCLAGTPYPTQVF
jgi:hypothetical protein